MKKNNILKYIIIIATIFLICIFLYSITSSVLGTIQPDDFKPSTQTGVTVLKTKAQNVLGIIQAIGSVISVVGLIVIGIKYMMGSVEEKAEYKKTMVPYLLGAIMVFATSNLVKIIYDFGQSISQ